MVAARAVLAAGARADRLMHCRTCDDRIGYPARECANCLTPAGEPALRYGVPTHPVRMPARIAAVAVAASTVVGAVTAAELVGLTLAAPAVLVWFHRAHLNLRAFTGPAPSFRSGWALTGWFVPGLNVYLPHSVMAEVADLTLWRDRLRHLAPIWWLAWLTGLVLVAVEETVTVGASGAALALNLLAGGTLIALMLRVSAAQEDRIARGAGPPPPAPGLVVVTPMAPVTGQRPAPA